MWPLLTWSLLIALILLHVWHERRRKELAQRLEQTSREAAALREEQQATLAQSHAQEQALFNSMVEGVLLLDNTHRIQLVNQSLYRLFSVTSDIRGLTIREAFPMHKLAELVDQLTALGTVVGAEMELPGVDKRFLQVNATAILGREQQHQGSILVFHDVTRVKELENTRQEFVANVSHELRTPLSLIKGFVETLLTGAKDNPEVATQFLQTIDKHSDRLTFLIEDLLTISRLESGQVMMNLQPTRLQEAAQRALDDLQSRAVEKQVTLKNEVPPDLHAHADADRLQQVLSNLIDNAIKYGRTHGTVTVGAQALDLKTVQMWVQDDGAGIAAEAAERVFERFYRVDRARSREQGGTGLGLSIVKHIVQSHGGKVWVKSEPGRRTAFFFTLPIE
jgi:two-component system, OmpR family, phosphate regulon sensor histidine kinase PhoR